MLRERRKLPMKQTCIHGSRALILIGLAVLALPAHADKAHHAIDRVNAEFSAAAAAGNAAGMAALYATDGQLMPPGSEPLRGTEAIRKFWEGALASGVGAVQLETLEVFEQGAIATEVGTYELKDKGGKALDHGKYIVVWRQEGGKWKLLRDMFSTNVPPAPTAYTIKKGWGPIRSASLP
jgi:uncharacterized protein (TIGR02246 family)